MADFPVSLLILNGKSAGNPALREAVGVLREEGYPLWVRVTWEKGDAERYVQEAVQEGVPTVIAGGGDGTINEVATCLAKLSAKQRPALGIIPLGTANDFATSAGIPEQPLNALRLAIEGTAYEVDLIQVNHDAFFINMATGGFGTKITTETPEKLKSALGGFSYFLHGLTRVGQLEADDCEVTGESFHWQGEALIIGIGNGRQAGGGQGLCPGALINDGLLDISIYGKEDLLPALVNKLTGDDPLPNAITGQSRWFTITAPNSITFNLDGEPMQRQEFHLEVHAKALSCRLPPDCPLIK